MLQANQARNEEQLIMGSGAFEAEPAPFIELSKQQIARLPKIEQRDYYRRK